MVSVDGQYYATFEHRCYCVKPVVTCEGVRWCAVVYGGVRCELVYGGVRCELLGRTLYPCPVLSTIVHIGIYCFDSYQYCLSLLSHRPNQIVVQLIKHRCAACFPNISMQSVL